MRREALLLFSCAWLIAACGSPKRDLGTASAGDGGSTDGGTGGRTVAGAAGFVDSGQAGHAGSDSASGGDDGASAGGEAGASGDAGSAGEPTVQCAAGLERSCADDGLQGSCALGTETCGLNGKWAACSISAKVDNCALGNDDSCNGVDNEGCGCVDGKDSACGAAKGNCAEGTQKCTLGVLAACTVTAKAQDSCVPGDDANCNGVPNEGCTCKNGETQSCGPTKAVGKCKPGVSTCGNGAYGACMGDVSKGNRDCRSKDDNDCDGVPDNTIDTVCACAPGMTKACNAHAGLDGKGICKAGTASCVVSADNSTSYWGSCSGDVGPLAKDCTSHLDNNCDGALDDAISGTCQCTSSSCSADTACKLSSSSSQCVACLSASDCSNGATCASNVCQCKAGFNGNRCQYQQFRGLGGVQGDANGSFANNISPDGSVVVGYSQSSDIATRHPWRFVNGVLNAIPRPSGQGACEARAVDSSLAIYGWCDNSSFQYANGVTSPLSFAPYTAYASDVSGDGKVVVGYADFDGQQAIRKSGSTTTLIPKLGTDFSGAYATSADGSVVVGDEYVFFHIGWYWTQKSGTVQLAQLADFGNYDPSDVSGDGKVIVGYDGNGNGQGERGVKWSGSGFSSIETKPGHYNSTSYDGKIIVGYTGDTNTVATVWDAIGAHPVSGYVDAATLSGWTLTNAVAVSNDGKWVAGNGTHNGALEPWVVHLP